MYKNNCAVIFGGTGFIGSFFAKYLLDNKKYTKIYLYDFELFESKPFIFRKEMLEIHHLNYEEVLGDVRFPIEWVPSESVDLIVNFAAVHREPGHKPNEYFETNIKGAQNINDWADQIGCKNIIFASSIAPYGPSEEIKDENSLTVPETPYGSSKLAAEKIHQIWLNSHESKSLIIVRPGVVFGPGEGGNVSRLIKAVQNRYFFYTGNRKTRKAGVYVKELCHALNWVMDSKIHKNERFVLFNMSMNPGPSIEEYVEAISKVSKKRIFIPSIPKIFIFIGAYLIELLAKPFGLNHPFSPIRIRKLVRSNNILPTYLSKNSYKYQFNLIEALKDWKKECPEEWK